MYMYSNMYVVHITNILSVTHTHSEDELEEFLKSEVSLYQKSFKVCLLCLKLLCACVYMYNVHVHVHVCCAYH